MNFQRMQAKTDFGSELFVTIVIWLSSTDFVNLLLPFDWICFHIASVTVQKEEILLKVDLFLSVQGRRNKSMLKIYSWEILLNIVTNTDEKSV